MFRWLTGRGAAPKEVKRAAERIDPPLWEHTVAAHGFLAGLNTDELEALHQRTAWLLASKSFNGAHGLVLDDAIMLSIAIQAALPILALDPALYEGWHEIIVYPGGFLIPRTDVDEAGVVHEYTQEAAGEAWDGGPVILSWEDAYGAGASAQGGANVVIHEFAHKLDLHGGAADGIPSLAGHVGLSPRQWRRVLTDAYDRYARALVAVEHAIPGNVDPESPEADAWYAALPLDPYAATDHAEFFAVSAETFFIDPQPLAQALPDWYDLLARYFRQNPLQRLAR